MPIGDIIRKHSFYTPGKVAMVVDDVEFTYKQLNERTNRVANFLIEKGIKKGDRISALLFNSHEFVEVYFAAAKVGAVFVPLNFRLTPSELEYQLNDCGSRLLVFHDDFVEAIQSISLSIPVEKDKFVVVGDNAPRWAVRYEDVMKNHSAEEPEPDVPVEWEDPQAIMYTSGVTGSPKGALLPHRKTLFNALNADFTMGLTSRDIFLSPLPLFHSGGLFIVATPTLYRGGTFITYKTFDPETLLRTIEKYKVTVFFALTTMLNFIVKKVRLEDFDTSSVRLWLGGGERTALSLLEHFAQKGIYMQTGFGQTENSILLFLPEKDVIRKKSSLGIPVFFCEVKIINDKGKAAAPFEVGEIVVKGPTVMMGYWNRPEDTARTVVDGWLHTGDLGYCDEEGYFYFVDRIKDMYRSGGENVYPAEIEKVLVSHPKIMNAAIIGVPDERWGETGKALIVPKEGEQMSKDDVLEYLKGKVAKYKFPGQVEFIDSFPMTASGKVLKSELKLKYGNVG